LINTLFETKLYQEKVIPEPGMDRGKTVQIESISAGPCAVIVPSSCTDEIDIEENGVRLKLTVVDTPGFGDYVNNEDRCAP
jgi:septin 7